MLPFNTDELTRMQAAQQAGMMDTCIVSTFAAGETDPYGEPSQSWTDGAATRCGLNMATQREVMDGTQVVLADAVLRLPIATVIGARDRVTVTHRFGVALNPVLNYEWIGEPMRGASGLRVNLRTRTNIAGG